MGIKDKEGTVYELTLDALIKKLKRDDCCAADVNAARAFMKDNSIEGGATMEPKVLTGW